MFMSKHCNTNIIFNEVMCFILKADLEANPAMEHSPKVADTEEELLTEHIGSAEEEDLGEVHGHVQVVVQERVILLRIYAGKGRDVISKLRTT